MTRSFIILGCDGSFPGPNGAASGYLIGAGDISIVLDLGPGSFSTLQRVSTPSALDAVIISHEHPDHMSDLDSLAVWILHSRKRKQLDVYAPPGVRERCYFADQGVFRFIESGPEVTASITSNSGEEVVAHFSRTDHGPETMAVHLSTPTTPQSGFAFSADTGPTWSPAAFDCPLTTYLCEASYLASGEGRFRHLSGRLAGSIAREAGVKNLITTHRWVTVTPHALRHECEETFGAGIHQAALGESYAW